MISNVTIEIINKNLKECWNWYKIYLFVFENSHYSDAKPLDFIEFCKNELYQCPNCDQIVWIEEQDHDLDDLNTDHVCDDCIEENGYYE